MTIATPTATTTRCEVSTSPMSPEPLAPVVAADARIRDVATDCVSAEPDTHTVARELAVWLSRLFDRPAHTVRVRTSPVEQLPCPRGCAYEITVAGHTIVITAREVPVPGGTVTRHAITVDDRPVPFVLRRPVVHLVWQLAYATWRAIDRQPHTIGAKATRA